MTRDDTEGATVRAVEPAYSYADLDRLGEGSRWSIDRWMREGRYPKPDFYAGRHPRWLASTILRNRSKLKAAARARGDS